MTTDITLNEPVILKETDLTIPTYGIANPEKNPMFLEDRVYQGSSGKTYPFPVTERVFDEKHDKIYKAVILENKYIQVTFLPELGGRIYRMLDKTNNYDFVYYNHVIKPALVGLAGPWISGGIEFNWPQHHRPDTFSPVNYYTKINSDGSKTIWMSDIDQMNGTKILVGFTMYPDKAYLKVDETFSNPTDLPQTFLWWANPAVPVNENTQSIFPPDVNAVFDHGKRAVSDFPIATGEYYKVDYSEGVDISRYKNVPVPTSYMAAKSKYDFLGNYDHQKEAGLLHVADHHTSPGKKQWTWGHGDFGQSWDHQLTDNDGPYIELMVGTFTDNQPDFSWLNPHEEKHSTEYFMPYKAVGAVKNATINAAVNLEKDGDTISIAAYATSVFSNAQVILEKEDEVLLNEKTTLSPTETFTTTIQNDQFELHELTLKVLDQDENILVQYTPKPEKIEAIPDAAKAIPNPKDIKTNDELFNAGQHLEQYRHASFRPENYYLEGLKRDKFDKRINDAYGLLLYRQGLFVESEKYFRRALERQNNHNTNPVSGFPSYHLGLSLEKQGKYAEAYDAFYKATWSADTKSVSFVAMAKIKIRENDLDNALKFINQALLFNYNDLTARAIKAHILILMKSDQAEKLLKDSLEIDNSASAVLFEYSKINPDYLDTLKHFIDTRLNDVLDLVQLYLETGQYADALSALNIYKDDNPLKSYYESYIYSKLDSQEQVLASAKLGASLSPDYIFPNRLFDVIILEYIQNINPKDGLAPYYLGNLYYDRRIYQKAQALWEKSVKLDPDYAMSYRNLSIVYYNKTNQPKKALEYLEKAFKLDPKNARLVFELDSLYQKMNHSLTDRLAFLEKHLDLVEQRDDRYIQLVTLLNETGRYKEAYQKLMDRIFHPWEGGEGKVSSQYEYALVELAKQDIANENYTTAIEKLNRALVYPRSLGEGKLPTANNNVIDFYLGYAYKQINDTQQANEHLRLATQGLEKPSSAMYYNDQPSDTIFYQGLAFEQLGQTKEANGKFHALISYGEKHIFDNFEMDYFAVSLPDALLFKDDHKSLNVIDCYYLIALGYLGLNQVDKAHTMMDKITELTNNHQGMLRHCSFKKFSL
ncbi:tetratricopeptide repeat protein [Pediococcus pentosaceus]|uniref:tetratricopeptide repeat protein n=1 Tax=Pediococcus pentosaceus TaxID=1255 RepID=UPI001C7D5A61|nr:DUF5107 domain-containing protein [Pediococcus pentosaceus]QYY85938.1 DUF5107 domain-containing protein [Pediococcus pentosaceus]